MSHQTNPANPAEPAQEAWILQTGAVTAVGDSAVQTATSVRAGLNRYRESRYKNRHKRPMTLALFPNDALPALTELPPGLTPRQKRMLRLADLAIQEIKPALPRQPIPLLLAGPEPFAGAPSAVAGSFSTCLMKQTGIVFDRADSDVYAKGRAGGLYALQDALDLLASGRHEAVLLGGVDTYMEPHLLAVLDTQNRVLAEGVMNGFCPGEGAGFVLLCSEQARAAYNLKPLAKVHRPGLALEPGHRYSKEPYRGDGLADAVRSALEVGLPPIGTVLSSFNGEHFGTKEWGVAFLRNRDKFVEDPKTVYPADSFGDIGAAFAPVLMGLAARGMNKGYLKGPSLIWCSSERDQRGAVCVTSLNNNANNRR